MLRARILLAAVLASASLLACSDDPPADEDNEETTTTTEDVPAEDDDGGDEETTTTTGSDGGSAGGDGDPCEAFQALADADDEFQGTLNDLLSDVLAAPAGEQEAAFEAFIDDIAELLDDEVPGLLEIYGELRLRVPDDLVDEVDDLRDFTSSFVDDLGAATSTEDLQELIGDLAASPEAQAAGAATLTLDELSREECDIIIAD